MSLPERLSSIGGRDDPPPGSKPPHQQHQQQQPQHGGGAEADPQAGGGGNLVQRCVIIQKDERGYGFTVSGDNPVFVASVKTDGAAMRAGVQQGDRIVKVNGTLVTSRNHLEVVKLIKSGSYVALTLLGRPHPSGLTSVISSPSNIANPRDSTGSRVTAPQPVDPDKDRELWQQKVHMTRTMYETAKEDFEKIQRQYVAKPSEKLHTLLLEKERMAKALENQLKQLTGSGDESTNPSNLVPLSNRFSDSEHGTGLEHSSLPTWQQPPQRSASSVQSSPIAGAFGSNMRKGKQSSVPSLIFKGADPEMRPSSGVSRSKSDAAGAVKHRNSIFYVGVTGSRDSEGRKRPMLLERAASLPTTTTDIGSMSDSPHTSPSVSPTPNDPHNRHNGQELDDGNQEIITNSDEDAHSEDDQANDPGPFADIRQLEVKPAHMAILLNYLISNSDPSPVLFHIISDSYSRVTGSTKELRKWAYEIYSTFIAPNSPLGIAVEDNVISQIDNILMTGNQRTDNENVLRTMFHSSRQSVQNEIVEQLADFRNKKDLGMGNFYGFQKLQDNMDRAAEIRAAEEVLIPHLVETAGPEDTNRSVSDRDQATSWALATFLRLLGGNKSSHSSTLDRVQTFMMKDKRSIKFPGSRSSRAKQMKGHQFTLQHFYVSTFCNYCGHLIWGVGYQGYQCQSCEMTLHKLCVEEISEVCGGKQKKRGPKWPSAPIRKPSNSSQQGDPMSRPVSTVMMEGDTTVPIQPYPKDEDSDLAGLTSKGHSVKSIVSRYESTSPTGPSPDKKLKVPEGGPMSNTIDPIGERRSSTDLSRSGSLNNKGEKSEKPARRAKSDVDVDSDTFRAINQSESSSASSLSKSSVESPSTSTDCMMPLDDSDLDVEAGLPSLKNVLGEEVLRKLKPKEKKRQEVINELFYTERAHLRKLKIIDYLFNRPMLFGDTGVMYDLARALFPNMDEMILLHESLVKDIKEKSQAANPVVADVGDILLKRFDGDAGERFRKGCAEYCRNQAFALDALKKQTRREPKLAQFLTDAHTNPLCRRLELKDLVPSQMQRLTKYPLLIESLLKYTTANSEEHKRLERAMERCRHILAYVNQAVKECENYHKLKDIQKKLDRKSVDGSNDPALADIKNLDLTQHKLIFDGPLTWKLRPHRTVDLHALLFDDMLVLLQKQDEKYVLKCQNTSMPSTIREEQKFTHSPVLRLQNLLARNLATEKKSFFVVNISESRAQMYEFIAATQELRIRWCKIINEKAEELKKSGNVTGGMTTGRSSTIIQPPQSEQVEVQRTTMERNNSTTTPAKPMDEEDDQVDSLRGIGTSDIMPEEEEEEEGELIQPEEVSVSNVMTTQSTPVRSPLERLRQNESILEAALEERERLVAEMLNIPWDQYQTLAAQQQQTSSFSSADTTSLPSTALAPQSSSSPEATPTTTATSIEEESGDLPSPSTTTTTATPAPTSWPPLSPCDTSASEEAPEVLIARAFRVNTSIMQLMIASTWMTVQQSTGSTGGAGTGSTGGDTEERSSPTSSPSRPLSTLSQGEASISETESSSMSSSGLGSQPAQQSMLSELTASHQAGGLNVPVPMDQLKAMAQEMNTILNKLVAAMSSGSEERHRLRQELTEAQQKLDFLKDLQRQMTLSGAVPTGRLSPRPSDSSPEGAVQRIPDDIINTLNTTQEQIKQQNEQQIQLLNQQQQQQASEEQAESAEPQKIGVSSEDASPDEKFVLASEEMSEEEVIVVLSSEVVHHGLQEATVTQLDESVEDLASHEVVAVETASNSSEAAAAQEFSGSGSLTGVIEVVAEEDEDDDDDDDNNEVSVADLPLPDVGTIRAEDESGQLSSMLDVVELEDSDGDSDTDNDTLTSRSSHYEQGLSTTVEDVLGERLEEEGGKDDEEEEEKRTLRGSVDDNENESGVKNSQVSLSDVAPSIEAVQGTDILAGGDGNTELRSSSVDPDTNPSKVTEDTMDPIQI